MKTIVKNREEKQNTVQYSHLLWLFVFGSFMGYIIEGVWDLLRRGAWLRHTATVWGPFNIIYGFGAVALYLIAKPLNNKNPWIQFFAFAGAGSAVELVGSWIQELFLGSVSWDYSDRFMNFQGRICLQMSVIWGVLGLLFVRFAAPLLSHMLEKTDGIKGWSVACGVCSAVMAVDLGVSACAIMRWNERSNTEPPSNAFESYLDDRYDDDYMSATYWAMVFVDADN